MAEVWFWLVAVLFTGWAVLDGFDFGVGVLHRFVAKTDGERREVFAAIGPVWDGNEVWLLAGAGSMFLAFPKLVAAGLSGLYLPVIFAVWCLILRGLGIELRSHLSNTLWRVFFDVVFQVGSTVFALLIGVALGNVIRGVPLREDGFFEQGLFGAYELGELGVHGSGAIDSYTLLVGLFVLLTLTAHGANYLRWKTGGEVNARVTRWAPRLWAATIASWVLTTWATAQVTPEVFAALPHRPLAWLGLAVLAGGLGTLVFSLLQKRELLAFLGSSAFIAGLLVSTVACLYPVLLRSRVSPELSLTVDNASSGSIAMQSGLIWWFPGVLLAALYFVWVLRSFRGKVTVEGEATEVPALETPPTSADFTSRRYYADPMARHVVIVGGGFGGIYAARQLAKAKTEVRVTVIDKQNYHLFQPLLYQVATAGLAPSDIASPIRALVAESQNVIVRMGEVTAIDLKAKTVTLPDGSISFDSLVLAAGVRHSYFGHDDWEVFAPGLKTLDDALEIRRRVLSAFEAAERETDPVKREAWLTFVVVGAGPTGVELAGAISELSRFTVADDFRSFDPRLAKVILIEAGPRVLASFEPDLADKALKTLEKLKVEVRLSTPVTNVTADGVSMGEVFVPARTVLWAAGVAAAPLAKSLGVPLDRSGRVVVQSDLSIAGHPDAFVIGDLASFTEEGGTMLPGLAPVAIQQGKHVSAVILDSVRGKPRKPFKYFDKGVMATVGRASGIAQTGKIKLWGFIGWLAWLFIHILYLIGFRNRLLVLIQWTWAWVTFGRGSRLITGTTNPPKLPSANLVDARVKTP